MDRASCTESCKLPGQFEMFGSTVPDTAPKASVARDLQGTLVERGREAGDFDESGSWIPEGDHQGLFLRSGLGSGG